ncbi:MAG: DUF1819 family protein [Desulfobacterium sp.]|nr:DUF1819 family protein [Desulfobacterium sp.]
MAAKQHYTSQLGAGLGLVNETKTLLELWSQGMSANDLYKVALESGRFPNITARRLLNIIKECFAPRYLSGDGAQALHLKQLSPVLSTPDFMQAMLIFTCRANPILGDFIRQIYWTRYSGGHGDVTNTDARAFVERAIDDGKTLKRWSESMVRNVSGYLTRCCADYGLLEAGQKTSRRIIPFHISSTMAAYLAHELHFSGIGDNTLLTHEDWQLFGLEREDVIEELKRLSLKGWLIVQSAGDVIRISWKQPNMEMFCNVLTQS